jgi:hypothetical protein
VPDEQRWLLTDAAADVWVDSFVFSGGGLGAAGGPWSVRKRTLRGGLRDGVDVIEVDNGALRFSVLPTRGLGLWRGSYRGLPFGWSSPVPGPVHPKFVDAGRRGGLGWLDGFDEWLCRCGLEWNGPPGTDRGAPLTLHGRVANLPANRVEVRTGRTIAVTGQVDETSLFGPRLRLTATYETGPGSPTLTVRDTVENLGGQPSEVQMLYHLNNGPPLLGEGARVRLPVRELSPLTARAAEGIDSWDRFAGPVAGYTEQVYAAEPQADPSGGTLALLHDVAAGRGLLLRWAVRELPCFTLWKNTAAEADGYVTGLEPATNFPNFKAFERQRGRVVVLPPGGRWSATWSLTALDTPAGVAAAVAEVDRVQGQAKPTVHRTPQARFSAAAGSP